jgi:RNA polymerase sigma-70 factor (ECF subfamily)
MSIVDSTGTDKLLAAAAGGDDKALEELFARHRAYLWQLVEVRLEPALRSRVDASDVVQDTLAMASRRFDEFFLRRPATFRLWLRQTALERLVEARRRHLAHKRDARRDISITDASSMAIARRLQQDDADRSLVQGELAKQVRGALGKLSEQDQEILLLRHAEGLTNIESAEVLGIDPSAASKRHGRAVRRLAKVLRSVGFSSY